ncbi:MAG TPA: siphovirus Gp157 family protein [Methyloceanibacter sp.]|jgi:hypothetical protein
MHPVKHQAKLHNWIRDRLLHEFPDADAETIKDTLEGLTDLPEILAGVIRSALIDQALILGLRERIEEMKFRLERIEIRGTKKRQLALDAMQEAGLSKLEQPDFTASTRPGTPSLIISAEDAIPATYWIPQPPKIDRQSMLASLKRGLEIPGALLSNPKPVLVVRTK